MDINHIVEPGIAKCDYRVLYDGIGYRFQYRVRFLGIPLFWRTMPIDYSGEPFPGISSSAYSARFATLEQLQNWLSRRDVQRGLK